MSGMLFRVITIAFLLTVTHKTVVGTEAIVEVQPISGSFSTETSVSIICHQPDGFDFRYFVHPILGQIPTSRTNYTVRELGLTVTLGIMHPTRDDAGTYSCLFSVIGSTSVSNGALGSITIMYRETVVVSTDQPSYEGFVGESLTLVCITEHADIVEWRTSPADRVIATTGRFTSSTSGELTINPVLLEDAGNYSCVAGNILGNVRAETQIFVTQRPTIEATPTFLEVELGERAVFTCRGEGYPKPRVSWVVVATGSDVDQDQLMMESTETVLNSSLVFPNVSDGDIGSYRCEVSNRGGSVSSQIILRKVGTLAAIENVILTIVDQTNILVMWDRPLASTVLSYTVTWQASNSNRTEWVVLEGPNPPNSYLITGLERVTAYSVFVHGDNEKGRGVDSQQVNITTDPIAPDNAITLSLVDLSPVSTGVVVGLSSLDNGGAELTQLSLQWRPVSGQQWNSQPVNIATLFVFLSGLQPSTEYQARAQVANRIGFGPFSSVINFTTSAPGFPGTPSQLLGSQSTSDSLLLCWNSSRVGFPFLEYILHGYADGELSGTWTVSVDDLEEGLDCYTLSGLEESTCYKFSIAVRNSRGVGQISSLSQEACTQPEPPTSPPQSNPMTMIIVAAVVVGVLLAVGVIVFVLLCLCCCVRLRQNHKYNLPNRRGSARSDATLMTYQTQTSSSSSSSDHSPQILAHVNNSFNAQSEPQVYHQGSNTLSYHGTAPQVPPPRGTHSLPGYYYNPQSAPPAAHQSGTGFEMTDNPYYKPVQLQQIPENEEHINYAYARVPLPLPPVEPPPYYSESVSDIAPSEVSSIQMGESYSQPSSSPRIRTKKKTVRSPSHHGDDTDFVDNGAYETLPQRGLQNGRSIYSDLESTESEPRFEIQSQSRGAVFETVQFRC